MEQCSLMATSEEQYVTIEIPRELIRHWRTDGYTHLHYGAIRLMLTLHVRRGLPVSARISLLDTSYLHYENAVIGTVLTTLHAGSVVLTLFPNYNVSLRDPTVPERLKVQVQITGVAQISDVCATLHYQIIYRLQTHAVNLALPNSNDSALFELIPLQWVTNYENLQKNHGRPIQTNQATFQRSTDGTVRTIFQQPEKPSGQIFQTMMLEPFVKEGRIPIHAVYADGKEVYTDRINGHFIWDVDPGMCDPECNCWMHSGDTGEEDSESDSDDEDPNMRYSTKPTIIPSKIGTDGKPKVLSQWTVLPFGLKVAPSLFQRAITKILEPLLDNAIIYIDDILLFSKDMENHKKPLNQFLERANLYGIMFLEKKIQLAQQEIDFLGMKFSQGTYQPQPHIAEELFNFPEENITVKQIQQFLGIINYIRDFIPRVARYTSPL
uniref:Polyprotein n=1 Tax=Cajanus cajan TaxID=3821 RepID=A0A151TPF2_CAJCA|nr:polyprotein [Cajanus cajan]